MEEGDHGQASRRDGNRHTTVLPSVLTSPLDDASPLELAKGFAASGRPGPPPSDLDSCRG